jgi:flavin reductase (DIM6/NTAB) family NADH-FMN oxidoreductase RutF
MSEVTDVPAANADEILAFGTLLPAMLPAEPGSAQVRTVFDGFPAAVGALCALVDGRPEGLVATSLTVGVSYDPPMVLFSVRNDSTTWPRLRRAPLIGVSVLGEDQAAVCRQIAAKGDRFAGVDTLTSPDGALFVDGAISWLRCSIEREVPAGDHAVVILRLHEVGHAQHTRPLVFHRSRFPVLRHAD